MHAENVHLKSTGYLEGIGNGPVMKLSIIITLRGCPFLKGTVSTYGCRTKLFPLQTERNHPAHREHGCRSAHGAP